MWPEVRIMAGIEASTITSLGTCRLVMPLSESTMASAGPSAMPCSMAALISAPSGSASIPLRIDPRPSFGLRPAAASVSPYCANTSGKNARTTWPKMIGSETFIIVALRCTENSTPSALARAICSVRNSRSAATRMTVASMTSPASTGTDSRSTVVVPSSPTSSMRSDPSASIDHGLLAGGEVVGAHVCDVRLRVRAPGAHRVRELARVVLDRSGARRSELPSRSTGFTALPLTLS